jgi:transcriptional regulator with XRE-family HTH domain
MSSTLCIMEWEDRTTGEGSTMSVLSIYVREEMDRQGVSKLELERRTGIPDSTLGHILNGEVDEPKPSQIAKIAKALGLTFWFLMQRGGYTTETPGDPDEETLRLADALTARPKLREIVREAEQLTPEEQDATLVYMVTTRQRRRQNRRPSRRKKPPVDSGDK